MTAPFTIYVMQSAHTDIGFTHPQEQIGLMYLDYYDRVLALCRQTEDMPEASRLKWTCETSWQARHYLAARPEREEEFLRYARAGQIELTASYLHFTDLIDPDAYRRSLDWALDYGRRHDLPLRCALHCDVNGWPWAVADILAESGIPYFCSQINGATPLGQRGAVYYHQIREDEQHMLRSDAPIRVPRAFWWEGPAGGRVLHWLGEHYHLGNALGLSSPHPFGADKTRYFTETDRLTVDDLYERARREVPRYLARLRAEGYQDDALLISTAGFYVDNSPPDSRWLQVIARWNSERDDIHLRTATLSEWFDRLAARDTGTWPTYRAAWPDYWAEGLGAATARVAQARRTQRRRADAVAVVDRAQSSSATAALATALEQERLALEHTFDAWCTTGRPGAAINDFQQTAKELTFHRAELYVDEAIGAALRAITPPGDAPRLYIHATVEGSSDDGFRVAHFDAGDQQLDPDAQALAAAPGERYPFQEDRRALKQYLAVLPVQQGGLQDFGLVARGGGGDVSVPPQAGASSVAGMADTATTTGSGERSASLVNTGPGSQRKHAPAVDAGQVEMETVGWSLRVDPATGGLASLRERATGREWVDSAHEYAFGQLVHEVIVHPFGRQAVFDPGRFVALGVASEELLLRFTDGPVFERATPTPVGTPRYVPGPVFDAVKTETRGERIGHAWLSWRLYHALPMVELALDWDKTWNDLPEAAYVAFPFAVPGGDLLLETGGGFFRPGSHAAGGQVPGTCPSYYTVQRAARLAAPDGAALLWLPLDAPLVMPNQLKFDNWETDPWAWNGFLASMPVNHYWFTNFPTSQRGPLRLRYRFVGARDWPDDETAVRTAMPVEALGWR